ncbi:MAG: YqgE/AlgH family protein [Alphaproteobacteria bacterium]|nr:YqgE/AlgH family protein [Alphaproteobacteria bacterium]
MQETITILGYIQQMEHLNNKYLTGKCLVATPFIDDERFVDTLVYICSHGKDGAMGFIVNRKLKDFSFADLAVKMPLNPNLNLDSMFLYQGGPIEKIRGFVLHSSEYFKQGTLKIDNNIAVSSSLDVLTDIAYGIGPENNLIALGYSGWEPLQLEKELIHNQWLVVDAHKDLLFNTPDELKWERALDETKIDFNRYINITGYA